MEKWGLDLRQYAYFQAVGQELHFARAAERLGISQPALSQQIRAMERQIGADLLARSGRRVALTPVGELLLRVSERLLHEATNARNLLLDAAAGNAGMVRIAYVASAALSGLLPRIVYAFRQQRPGVQVDLQEMTMLEQVRAVASGAFDIGFIRPPVPDFPATLHTHDVLNEPMMAAVRPDHPYAETPCLDVGVLKNDTFICTHRSQGVGMYELTTALCKNAGFIPRIEVFSAQTSIIISMVAAGFGVALVPESIRRFAPADVRMLPLKDTSVRSTLSMIYARQNPSPAVHAFIHCVTQAATPFLDV
jgi:DNA-binding transcriptional LysR family regulator